MKYFLAIFAFLTSSFNFLTKENKNIVPILQVTPMASMMPSESPTPHPNSNFSDFIYPGAQTVSQTSAILSLQSSDDTQTIINWYQAKINGNYSERSDNVSNTNGNVSALLSGIQ